MKFQNNFGKSLMLTAALLFVSFTANYARLSNDYRFKVHNNTKQAIKKILASEDGKTYGYFDIGNGIAPGATIELVWDKSTDNGNCHQYFKAIFADGEESQPVKFDFCEKDLVLEF